MSIVNNKAEAVGRNRSLNIESKELDSKKSPGSIVLKSKAILPIKDICYIKADGPYIEYYIVNREKPEIDRNSLKKVSSVLLENDFVQIYRSIIVNKFYIGKSDKDTLWLINGIKLPVSNYYRKNL